jgi:quinoprotein glucose dehydrogenase
LTGLIALALISVTSASAVTQSQLIERFQQLPSVEEKDLPKFSNQKGPFLGGISNSALRGFTWVKFPFVENPGSFGFDHQGRLYVAETHRFWLGVPDLRGAGELVRGDFQSRTVEDRVKLYEEWSHLFPQGWFNAVADRVVRLEDRDGNGAADRRTIFADGFNDQLDGIGFSVLAGEDSIYYTCIPSVWKLTDKDGDGVAEEREAIVRGFGTQVSFIGHDLHGLTWGPDGKLYFSVGDRGYNITSKEGTNYANPCRGGIFRCNPDGSGFEVYCYGLRNPQELAFDDYGNLFTFDNTGDIGDVARMVYALEGSDSGWHMAHQSPHHYATVLDWGDFRPEKSMWVAERMFDTFNDEQPQWVYPPASHVARGPSGVTWLTGDSIPENLRNGFLLANYRGASVGCTVLSVKVEPARAGFKAVSEEVVVEGVGVTDVEQGFDGRIYLCDWGGGWTVNQNGSIQVLEAIDDQARKSGEMVAELFKTGFGILSEANLSVLLGHPDRRVRQQAQFQLAKRNDWGALANAARNSGNGRLLRLHALWGMGQIAKGNRWRERAVTGFLGDKDNVLRANAARIVGDLGVVSAKTGLLGLLMDSDAQVRSLAAIALGKVSEPGDNEVVEALFALARKNGEGEVDPVIRHSCLAALERLNAVEASAKRAESTSREERLTGLLVLRRAASAELANYLSDADPVIRREAVRAIYDTDAAETQAGEKLAAYPGVAELPETVQRRVVAENFRLGGADSAGRLLAMAGDGSLAMSVRESALHGLRAWTSPPVTDPVNGWYRPVKTAKREASTLLGAIGSKLGTYIASESTPRLLALALRLANEIGLDIDPKTLESQVFNTRLEAEVRVATLDSLVKQKAKAASGVVERLLSDKSTAVRAAAMRHAFAVEVKGISDIGEKAVRSEELEVARAAIGGLAKAAPKSLLASWEKRGKGGLRSGLALDVFLALTASTDKEAVAAMSSYADANSTNVFLLSENGGDVERGRFVFENHGACLQCHKIKDNGGIQGPALDGVGKRLTRAQVLESIYNPNAVVAAGFASVTATMKDDSIVTGRLVEETKDMLRLIAPDGAAVSVKLADVAEKTPPVSAMPPIGAALPPQDLRDLVAYISSLKQGGGKQAKQDGH